MIYDVFQRTGSFESLGQPKIPLKMNYYDLYILIFWFCLLGAPILYGAITFILNATLLMNILVIGVLLISKKVF